MWVVIRPARERKRPVGTCGSLIDYVQITSEFASGYVDPALAVGEHPQYPQTNVTLCPGMKNIFFSLFTRVRLLDR